MANNYYNRIATLTPGIKARSDTRNTEFGGIETAFDFLPTANTAIVRGSVVFGGVTGGASNAYTVSRPDVQLTNTDGDEVTFRVDRNNTGAATLDVDTIGAVALVRPDGTALGALGLITGIIYRAVYQASTPRWQLFSAFDTPTAIVSTSVVGTSTDAPSNTSGVFTSNLVFVNLNTVQVGSVGFNNNNNFRIQNDTFSGSIELQARDTAGNLDPLALFDPDGASVFYQAGGLAAGTNADGFFVQDPSVSDLPTLLFENQAGATLTVIGQVSTSDSFDILNQVVSGWVRIRGTDAASATKKLFRGDPDGAAELFWAGNDRFATTLIGADVFGSLLDLDNSSADALTRVVARNSIGSVDLQVLATSGTAQITQRTDADVLEDIWISMVRDGAVSIYHNNIVRIASTAVGADVTGTEFNVINSANTTTIFAMYNSSGGIATFIDATTGDGHLSETDNAGVLGGRYMNFIQNGAVEEYFNAQKRTATTLLGFDVFGTIFDLDNSALTTRAALVARNSGGGVHIAADSAGNMEISQLSAAGAVESGWISGVRNGKTRIAFNSISQAESKNGGFVIVNELEMNGALNHDGSTAGFYGTTPITKQTGVAVTIAALHAAVVALGLIAA